MHCNPVKPELQHVSLKVCVFYLLIKYNNAYSVESGVHCSQSKCCICNREKKSTAIPMYFSVNKNVLILVVLTFQLTLSVFLTLTRDPDD